jgi:hypothetical protein
MNLDDLRKAYQNAINAGGRLQGEPNQGTLELGKRYYEGLHRTHLGVLLALDIRCMRGDNPAELGGWINNLEGAALRRKCRYAAYWIRYHTHYQEGDENVEVE